MRTEKPREFIGLLTQALYREAKSQSRQSQVKQLHVSYGFAIKRDILSYTLEAAGRWPGGNAAITKSGSVMLFLKKCVGNYTHAWVLPTSYKPKQSLQSSQVLQPTCILPNFSSCARVSHDFLIFPELAFPHSTHSQKSLGRGNGRTGMSGVCMRL